MTQSNSFIKMTSILAPFKNMHFYLKIKQTYTTKRQIFTQVMQAKCKNFKFFILRRIKYNKVERYKGATIALFTEALKGQRERVKSCLVRRPQCHSFFVHWKRKTHLA